MHKPEEENKVQVVTNQIEKQFSDESDDDQEQAESKFWLPSALMSIICAYLTHKDYSKMSQASVYFNQCVQTYFKTLIV